MTTMDEIIDRLDSLEGDAHEISEAVETAEMSEGDKSSIRMYVLAVLASAYELRHELAQLESAQVKKP